MTSLPVGLWRDRAGLDTLLAVLGSKTDDIRLVGGFVRDSLLGIATHDVDCATRLRPETVLERLDHAKIKAVPTGIAHGTITAILASGPVEVTTLRRDVATDGRRATIAYTDDWREDAARRDFTINALFAEPETGAVDDYFGGLADLTERRVRFIGEPLTRIAEDHLRILRFFRFHARFGQEDPDPAALNACIQRANDLMALSRERIADELLKLLSLDNPAASVALMVAHNIFRPILPEVRADAPDELRALISAEHDAGVAPDPLRRLAALLPRDENIASAIGARLKLSNAQRKRLIAAAQPGDTANMRALAYRIGPESAADHALLSGHPEALKSIEGWQIPRLPISGGALIAQGLKEGPAVAATLKAIEKQWIAEDFPDEARVRAIAAALISRI